MTTIAISALPTASSTSGSDVFPIVQSGVTRQLTNTLLFTNTLITNPTLITPAIGTPTSGNLTNCTGSPTLITPALGTPSSGILTNCTGTPTLVLTNCTGSPTLTNIKYSGLIATTAAAPTLASATTIAPTTPIVFVSGTVAIVTITEPSPISLGGGQITLVPTGVFTWTTGGNIALAGTAVVSKAITFTFDVTTTKWYPSYV